MPIPVVSPTTTGENEDTAEAVDDVNIPSSDENVESDPESSPTAETHRLQ